MDAADEFDKLVLTQINGKEREIKKIYFDAILDIAGIASRLPYKFTVFNFRAYPMLQKRVTSILKKMQTEIHSSIVNGIDGAWELSDRKNVVYVDKNLKGLEITPKAREIYYDSNIKAKEAFKQETVKGLKLSDRVWKTVKGFQPEIEEGVAFGIANGESASDMAKRMQKYLNKPEELRKKIIAQNKLADEAKAKGVPGPKRVKLRKAIKDYHPGQGVYRSSYKNALRLTRDQINRGYRKADQDRWSAQSFVVGISIRLSNNHPKKPENEMCEQLAGDYPKSFKWPGGWHIQCLCVQTPIFITAAERKERRHALINGEKWEGHSDNEVTDVPENFKAWVKENSDRIKVLKTIPEFIKKNEVFTSS